MKPGTTYIKTDSGRAEIAARAHALAPVQRRLLILIDGKKTINDLLAFVRVGELDTALEHLLQEGLIESSHAVHHLQAPVAPGFAAASPTELPRPATDPDQFKEVRSAASHFVLDRLGASGEPICAAIERCDSPAELRKLLRGVEIFIGQRLSAETTQDFARHFGALLL